MSAARPGRDAAHRDRRSALLDTVCDHLLAHGLPASSLRHLADAAGTSDRMLLYYFQDKADLMEAALARLAQRLTAGLEALAAPEPLPEDALRARLVPLALDPGFAPFMRVWLELVAAAGRGDPICRTAGERIAGGFLTWIEAQLDIGDPAARWAAAARILATLDGLITLDAVGHAAPLVAAIIAGPPRDGG